MAAQDKELEVKFFLADLPALEQHLQALDAALIQPRVHEINLRFDTAEGELSHSYQVLRLRQDRDARLTYKGPGEERDGVRLRKEIEFTVGDFAAAQRFLEALGYRVIFLYEKYRAVYALGGVHVTLDEMPFGNFAEIEGAEPQHIQETARLLGLSWAKRILGSYTDLFDRSRQVLGFDFRDLSFDNFAPLNVLPEHLDLKPADEP